MTAHRMWMYLATSYMDSSAVTATVVPTPASWTRVEAGDRSGPTGSARKIAGAGRSHQGASHAANAGRMRSTGHEARREPDRGSRRDRSPGSGLRDHLEDRAEAKALPRRQAAAVRLREPVAVEPAHDPVRVDRV